MEYTTLKFGIIGLGNIAGHHIKSIQEIDGCKVVAISSSNEEKRKNAVKELNAQTFVNFNEMLSNVDIDVICICTPSGFHLEPALAAAKKGIHIISEKPLEISVERASKMIEVCKKNNVYLACIFQNRYSSDFQKLLQIVEANALGKPVLGNAYVKWHRDQAYYNNSNWRGTLKGDGGAALINQGIHTVDLLLKVMGPVKSVMAKTKTLTHNIEGEDLAIALLEFESGAFGTIECSTSIYNGFPEKLEIHGSDGSIILEGGRIKHCNVKDESPTELTNTDKNASGSSDPMAISYQLHKQQLQDIVTAIKNHTSLNVDGKEGLKSIELIEAIYKSAKTGKEIFL